MTQTPTNSGSSLSGGPGSQVPFPKNALSFDGPETVINPERRAAGSGSGTPQNGPGSSIWTRLFPKEAAAGGEYLAGPVDCRLGHFRIEAMIGAGGMGAVFRASTSGSTASSRSRSSPLPSPATRPPSSAS